MPGCPAMQLSEGGTTRLETIFELEFLNSSFSRPPLARVQASRCPPWSPPSPSGWAPDERRGLARTADPAPALGPPLAGPGVLLCCRAAVLLCCCAAVLLPMLLIAGSAHALTAIFGATQRDPTPRYHINELDNFNLHLLTMLSGDGVSLSGPHIRSRPPGNPQAREGKGLYYTIRYDYTSILTLTLILTLILYYHIICVAPQAREGQGAQGADPVMVWRVLRPPLLLLVVLLLF